MATGYSQEWSARNSIYTAYFRIYYATSYNASTNTSTVTITPQLKTSADFGNDYRIFNGAGLNGAGVYGNGVCLYSFGTNYGSGNYLSCGSAHSYYRDLGSWSFTVSHNANGDASFTVGIYGSVLAMYFSGTGYTYNQCFIGSVGDTVSDTITIHENANAASSIASSSASVSTLGTYLLTMNRKSSTNYHVVTFLYNNSTVLYSSGHFGTSYDLDIPRSFFRNYPSLSSLPVTVSVQTYNSSGTAIGSPATTSLTIYADADMKPVVSSGWVSLAPYNTGAVSGFTGYVQGYSRAQATFNSSKISMTNAVGASIASYSVTCQGATDNTSPYQTGVLSSTSASVVCTVTDTRGRSASQTFTLSVMAYAKPKLTGISIFRCNTNGAASEDGTKYSAKATMTYSSLNGKNTATLVCAVAAAGGSYGSSEALTSGQARISTANLNADTSYTVRITATDALGNTDVYYQVLPTRKWAMKFRPNGQGVAFGKAAEYDKTFEVAADWTTRLGGNLIVGGLPGYKDLTMYGSGQNWYIKVATITITGSYVNRPLVFEFVGRGQLYSVVQILFASVNNTDPGISSFTSSNNRDFYIRKTATSTWELIAKYSEPWGDIRLCRYFTSNNPSAKVTIGLTNIGTSAPSGLIQCVSELLNVVYPVGSIYMSVNSTSPSTLFGGTWERIQDRFLLAAGSTYAAGNTGGEATHTLTVEEIPSHNHRYAYNGQLSNMGTESVRLVANDRTNNYTGTPNGYTGGGQAHNNMPPYLTVYMWKRTA